MISRKPSELFRARWCTSPIRAKLLPEPRSANSPITASKASAWDAFRAAYRDLQENESKLFNEVVYPALRQGYLETHEAELKDQAGAATAPGAASGTVYVPPVTPPNR